MLLHHTEFIMVRGAAHLSAAARGEAHGARHVVVHRARGLTPFDS